MNVISSEGVPIKLWLDPANVEEDALQQAKNLANLPFTFKHIALMPDCHQGYGMPIGGVLATKGVIIPNAVGVDIGCGVCAIKTSVTSIENNTLQQIVDDIKKIVPVGFEWHAKSQDESKMPQQDLTNLPVIQNQYKKATQQLGTLGGGNHFIEIQKGSDDNIWIMIHSGSRNLGKKVADHYNEVAVKLNEQWHSVVPKKWELAFLPINSDEAKTYRREMEYCVEFALANRKLMMENIHKVLAEYIPGIDICKFINIAHNYAAMENHFEQNVMVHRKGATSAKSGQMGIIPGSQGTKSYIVSGKNNPESFNSCSHGAGRRMGRKKAMRELDLKEQQYLMNSKGILHSIKSVDDLDEAPGAYKDIDEVMQNQEDLVEIVVELTPLAVIKG